jgi:hypothetical protein
LDADNADAVVVVVVVVVIGVAVAAKYYHHESILKISFVPNTYTYKT